MRVASTGLASPPLRPAAANVRRDPLRPTHASERMPRQQRLQELAAESGKHAAATSEALAQLGAARARLAELGTEVDERVRAFTADLHQARHRAACRTRAACCALHAACCMPRVARSALHRVLCHAAYRGYIRRARAASTASLH